MFFKYIYYFIGVAIAMHEFYKMSHAKYFEQKGDELIKYHGENKDENGNISIKNLPADLKNFSIHLTIWMVLELGWTIIGLFTYNWVAFIALLIWNFISSKLLYAPFVKYKNYIRLYNFVVRFILILFIFFVTLNSFHLHIDLISLIFGS